MSEHLYRRRRKDGSIDPVWKCWFRDANGKPLYRSTGRTDKEAARKRLAEFERTASAPGGTAAAEATLGQVLENFLQLQAEERRAGNIAQATLDFYIGKAAHWTRILGARHELVDGRDLRVALLDAPDVDAYVSARRGEWAKPPASAVLYQRGRRGEVRIPADEGRHVSDQTIKKELLVLRMALERAQRSRLWFGELDQVLPADFAAKYEPRARFLSPAELELLLAQILPGRAARCAFIVASSARLKESDCARVGDAGDAAARLRGTKTTLAARTVPVTTAWQRQLLAFALEHADGGAPALFRPWARGSLTRDLRRACRAAGIAPASPNDLRRTFGVWMRAMGVPVDVLASMMGHVDSVMVERVYGRLTPELLHGLVAQLTGAHAAPLTPLAAAVQAGARSTGAVPARRTLASIGGHGGEAAPQPLGKAGPTGFEPVAFGFVGQRPLQLSARITRESGGRRIRAVNAQCARGPGKLR